MIRVSFLKTRTKYTSGTRVLYYKIITEKFLYKIRFYTVREQTSKVLLTAICSYTVDDSRCQSFFLPSTGSTITVGVDTLHIANTNIKTLAHAILNPLIPPISYT